VKARARVIFGEKGLAHPSSSADATSQQSSSISLSTSLTVPSSSDYSNDRILIPIQFGASVRTKRSRDSSHDNSNRKRSSTTQ